MGSLDGNTIEVQAQYNWVVKANCTEFLHLLNEVIIVIIINIWGSISSIFRTFLVIW